MTSSETTPHFGLLQISGQDSERLLQGQLTCDVSSITSQEWRYGACCNAKGRMVANFIISRQGEQFILRLPDAHRDAFQAHFAKYAVFYKVKITPLNWQRSASLSSPKPTPESSQVAQWDTHCLTLQWPDGRVEHWDSALHNNPEHPIPNADEPSLSEKQWHDMDIMEGVVWITEPTSEQWIPQHIGWDKLGGVSFTKGCYTGQEVVARLQYLGKSKRELVRFQLEQPGDAALLQSVLNDTTGKTAGELVSLCGIRGLAVVQTGARDNPLSLSGQTLNAVTPVYTEE